MAEQATDIVCLYRMLQDVAQTLPGATPDIVSRTWERLLRAQFEGGEIAVELVSPIGRGYALRALRWELVDQHRRDSARVAREKRVADEQHSPLPWTHAPLQNPEQRLAFVEALRRVWQSFSQHEREIMTLLYVDGLSRAEVAKQFGISDATLRQRLHRARERARQALAYE